jgi:hypothetical protein
MMAILLSLSSQYVYYLLSCLFIRYSRIYKFEIYRNDTVFSVVLFSRCSSSLPDVDIIFSVESVAARFDFIARCSALFLSLFLTLPPTLPVSQRDLITRWLELLLTLDMYGKI